MSDLEMTRLCAQAMGLSPNEFAGRVYPDGKTHYDPLHDDAQAMALVKRFGLNIGQLYDACKVFTGFDHDYFIEAESPDLNRAICECVAKMQEG